MRGAALVAVALLGTSAWAGSELSEAFGPAASWRCEKDALDPAHQNVCWQETFTAGFGPFTPAIDLKENRDAFIVTADVPGIARENLQVTLAGNKLVIRGKRPAPASADQKTYSSERRFGEFERSFTLPDGVGGGPIDAQLRDGVLTVRVPRRAESAAQKNVSISASGDEPDRLSSR